jgi:hypothetical protein
MNFQSLNLNLNQIKKEKEFYSALCHWAETHAWPNSRWRAWQPRPGLHGPSWCKANPRARQLARALGAQRICTVVALRSRRRAAVGRPMMRCSPERSSFLGAPTWQHDGNKHAPRERGDARRWLISGDGRSWLWWSMVRLERGPARFWTTRGASGARQDTRRKTSSRRALAYQSGAAIADATMTRQNSSVGEVAPVAQGAALRYGGAPGPM